MGKLCPFFALCMMRDPSRSPNILSHESAPADRSVGALMLEVFYRYECGLENWEVRDQSPVYITPHVAAFLYGAFAHFRAFAEPFRGVGADRSPIDSVGMLREICLRQHQSASCMSIAGYSDHTTMPCAK